MQPKTQSGTTTLSEKRSDSGCVVCKIKPGYKTENISRDVCTQMVAMNYRRQGFFKCIFFSVKTCQKYILQEVNSQPCKPLQRSTPYNITPSSKDAFMRRGTFVVPPSSMCSLVSACFLVFVTMHVIYLFAYCSCSRIFSHKRKRQVMFPHLQVPNVCSSHRHLDVTVCFCVCITSSGLVHFRGCVCIHHSENMCVLNVFVCVCEFPTHFILSFFLSL